MKVPLIVASAVSLLLLATPLVAPAQESGSMHGMDHGEMHAGPAGDDVAAIMDRMMADMHGIEPTGDADADFLLMMIPHHQSAVDMAKAMLPDMDDPETEALARAIVASQEAEIVSMRAMLDRLGHAPASARPE